MKRAHRTILLATIFSGFLFVSLVYNNRALIYSMLYPRPDIGAKAPEFALIGSDKTVIKLSKFEGKIIFLHFMASWCSDCQKELPKIQALYNQKKSEPNFIFLNVAFREDRNVTQSFILNKGYDLPIYGDPKGETARLFGILGIPAVIIIDAKGMVRTIAVGAGKWEKLFIGH